ncbi:uncharacterized protein Z518_08745 [Rhinocladiella mackenziei CBS 650.93]|uniref:Uncharacterized protein n=1 Tax=Rhinocladiella mackenziei CBS 650.93 TaxID=1442369 RepID=A0A0D2FLE2_9EURO|nr:uncharacterized protein Z518_08745 [Rhinocladiella mackenziei CBS 650.93]KIX02802.1 hypothetical protein Z518_08745 [Rhinocladiella mackenziei CBS 650.93]
MNEDHPYYHVASLLRKVHRHRGPYLSPDDLESLGIKVSGMDIKTGRPTDSGQQFCTLYPSKQFDKLFEKVSAKHFQDLDEGGVYGTALGIGTELDHCLDEMGVFDGWDPSERIIAYCIRSRNDSIVEQRLGNGGRYQGEPEFQAGDIFETYKKSIPHRGCTVFDTAVSDERLRKSEVFCAAGLMAARLGDADKTGDRIVPVFIYSFSGYQARVIQAHYEHPHFIIRKTEHIEFEDGSADGFKVMLRWMMNIPKGDVKMPNGKSK